VKSSGYFIDTEFFTMLVTELKDDIKKHQCILQCEKREMQAHGGLAFFE